MNINKYIYRDMNMRSIYTYTNRVFVIVVVDILSYTKKQKI
jgi:hypothetical protein